MINVLALKEFFGPLGWFITLGASDTENMRNELQDLLHHTSQSLKSLIELTEVLEHIDRADFNKESFAPIFSHCRAYLTGPESVTKARTHCTDIARDINRINFKAAKYLRAEWGTWKSLDEAFEKLENADETFLDDFEKELVRIDDELVAIFNNLHVTGQVDQAWNQYESLRLSVLKGKDGLKDEIKRLTDAENHIRKILT